MVIGSIAKNTFKEAVRDKVLYNLLIFTAVIISASVLLGQLTIGQDQRVIKDVGLASMSLFGVLIATFVGTSLIHKEISRRTIYNMLSKPIHRYEFVLGKYCGLMLTVLIELSIMTAVLFAVLIFHKVLFTQPARGPEPIGYISLLKAVALIFFELMLVTSIAILFSVISSPTLSVFFTLSAYVVGHLAGDIKELGASMESSVTRGLCSLCYYVLPNLENFNVRAEMVRGIYVSGRFMLYAVIYGLFYMAAVLLISVLYMERKEFI
jgi:ABC-type transport system involved in multi-copper enzyme maturation permease subunit